MKPKEKPKCNNCKHIDSCSYRMNETHCPNFRCYIPTPQTAKGDTLKGLPEGSQKNISSQESGGDTTQGKVLCPIIIYGCNYARCDLTEAQRADCGPYNYTHPDVKGELKEQLKSVCRYKINSSQGETSLIEELAEYLGDEINMIVALGGYKETYKRFQYKRLTRKVIEIVDKHRRNEE